MLQPELNGVSPTRPRRCTRSLRKLCVSSSLPSLPPYTHNSRHLQRHLEFFDSEHCTSGTQLNAKDRLPAVYSTAALVDTSGAWVSKEAFQLLQQSPVFNGRIGVGLTWVPQDNLVAGQWRGIEAQGERQRFLEGHRREPGLLTLTNI